MKMINAIITSCLFSGVAVGQDHGHDDSCPDGRRNANITQ